jgi:hypothetical protein
MGMVLNEILILGKIGPVQPQKTLCRVSVTLSGAGNFIHLSRGGGRGPKLQTFSTNYSYVPGEAGRGHGKYVQNFRRPGLRPGLIMGKKAF